ncbi:uncharacterized protein LOC124438555 isoform X2 [Xenia sp. Carnegie-2017]|uniref:uncharacterized protein LOC124438555 isoform X2 n=1 Tax=Xenia sp. Carnegie-2017 TaxID=2897299 RepID=UPI001F0341C6|nr:uncharacterized protein LOC124438555 isoform X2 [Xenia sp. Carnegie-2017]
MTSHDNQAFLNEELKYVREKLTEILKGTEIVACHIAMVQVKIKRTKYKQTVAHFQFPKDYPQSAILIELKSKTLSEKLLNKLVEICDQEAKKHISSPQKFLDENFFSICSDEINYIKKNLINPEKDELKIKSKSGTLSFNINQDKFYMTFKIFVPDNYPGEPVRIEETASNFPGYLRKVFLSQAEEIARKCVSKPLKRNSKTPPFEPKSSLQPVVEFLVNECIKRYPKESCPLCHKQVLPEKPEDVIKDTSHPNHLERVYCSHIYHFGCLDKYMKTPPFKDKKCPACKSIIYHEKWNVSAKVAEDRWAHKQAKQRELEEVVDFLAD